MLLDFEELCIAPAVFRDHIVVSNLGVLPPPPQHTGWCPFWGKNHFSGVMCARFMLLWCFEKWIWIYHIIYEYPLSSWPISRPGTNWAQQNQYIHLRICNVFFLWKFWYEAHDLVNEGPFVQMCSWLGVNNCFIHIPKGKFVNLILWPILKIHKTRGIIRVKEQQTSSKITGYLRAIGKD